MFFKRHRGAKQDCLLITSQGERIGCSFEATPDSIIDFDNARAWEIDFSQQFKRGNKIVQLICEWDQTPIQVFKGREPHISEASNNIFYRKFKEALSLLDTERRNTSILLWLGIIAVTLAIPITILVL